MTLPITKKIGWKTAAGVVIANMIGTGVFTSLGFQLVTIKNTWSIIALWMIGGILSLIGAFVYAELGTHFKKSGGDYIFLSRIFHPIIGYLYAWTSLTVGFSAPIAIAAMAMVYYLKPFLSVTYGTWTGIFFIVLVSIFHSVSVKQSGVFHTIFTLIKIIFAITLVIAGFYFVPEVGNSFNFTSSWLHEMTTPGFAVSLVYVSYAYTGWNSAAYIVEEIKSPGISLPRALITGTLFVTVVYVLLQLVFLKHGSPNQLTGKVDVATIAFSNLFSGALTPWIGAFISIQLIATISGYIWIGPRVTFAMAREFKLWKRFSYVNKDGVPVKALWLNSFISIVLVFSGSFEQVLLYAGMVLQLMGMLTVLSSLYIDQRSEHFKSPWKPFLQIVYILFSMWIIVYTAYERPLDSLVGFGIIAVGIVLYIIDRRYEI